VLPVSIERVPAAFDELLAAAPERPDALLSLGVQRGGWFRLERRARAALSSAKRDNDGLLADGVTLAGPEELATSLDLDALAGVLREAGADDVRTSDDAGGFVCERAYHHGLTWASVLDVPALFLHVPPLEAVDLDAQTRVVGALARALVGVPRG